MYVELDDEDRIFHFMGKSGATRHLVMRNLSTARHELAARDRRIADFDVVRRQLSTWVSLRTAEMSYAAS